MKRFVVSPAEIAAVSLLAGPRRYAYFVKRVVDWSECWGLWRQGWATGCDEGGRLRFPLWPALEFAAACAHGAWSGYEPSFIPLEDLLGELSNSLTKSVTGYSVFPTESAGGVGVEVSELLADLQSEGLRYS